MLHWVERELRACRRIALKHFRSSSLRIERKPDNSPVTIADRTIEAHLRRAFAKAFPGEAIVGEEFGRTGPPGSTYWVIDPIDGTRAFSRGLPSWGTLIARVERGQSVLGVCDYPVVGVTLGVAPGVRAYERIGRSVVPLPRPRPVRQLRDSVIFHGGAKWWERTRWARGFRRLIANCYLERAYGDCYGYLWGLRGYADAVTDCGVKTWDMAPFAALAQATGRVLVNFKNQPSFSGPDTLMTSPALAPLICRTLTRAT